MRSLTLWIGTLAVAFFACVPNAQAQLPLDSLAPASLIRMSWPGEAPGRWHTAFLSGIGRDSLTLVMEGQTENRTISLRQLSRLEVNQGRKSAVLSGMGIGAASGFAVGYILGAVTYEDDPDCWLFCLSRGEEAVFAGIAGTGVGLLVGAVAGAAIGKERWTAVRTRTALALDLVPAAADGGVKLKVALRF